MEYHLSMVNAKKISFKQPLTSKNLVSIIYHQEIYEMSWILTGYHWKSKNSLKRDYMGNIAQVHLNQI